MADELVWLRVENARLLRLLGLTRREAEPPGPVQAGFFESAPGLVTMTSPLDMKVAFFGALFAARTDVYAARWDNLRTGRRAGFLRFAAAGEEASGMPTGTICR